MKKFLLTLLVIVLGVVQMNAADITRRIWAYCDWGGEWQSTNNSIRIHYYKSDGTDITSWDASNTQYMSRFNSTNWFFYDITADESVLGSVKVIIRGNSGNQTQTYNNDSENMDLVNKCYMLKVENIDNTNRATVSELKYYLVNTSNNNSLTEMETSDCCTFHSVIDNQTTVGSSYYVVAPGFAISNGSVSAWGLVFRPWFEHQNLAFENVSDRTFFAEDNNNNSWCSNNVPAKFELSLNTLTWKYAVSAYFEKSVASGDAYATFSYGNAVDIPDGVTVYSLTQTSATSVRLNKENITALSADNGVLISGGGKFYPATTTATAPANNILAASVVNGVQATLTTNDFILAGDGADLGFYHPSAGGTLGANKAYIPANNLTSNPAKLSFDMNDDVTAINEVNTVSEDDAFYTLQGVRVNNAQKGIFIINGKKVVLK